MLTSQFAFFSNPYALLQTHLSRFSIFFDVISGNLVQIVILNFPLKVTLTTMNYKPIFLKISINLKKRMKNYGVMAIVILWLRPICHCALMHNGISDMSLNHLNEVQFEFDENAN